MFQINAIQSRTETVSAIKHICTWSWVYESWSNPPICLFLAYQCFLSTFKVFSSKLRAGAFPGSLIVQMWSGFLKYLQYREDMKVFAWKPMKRRVIFSNSDLVFKKDLLELVLKNSQASEDKHNCLDICLIVDLCWIYLWVPMHSQETAILIWFCTRCKAH